MRREEVFLSQTFLTTTAWLPLGLWCPYYSLRGIYLVCISISPIQIEETS